MIPNELVSKRQIEILNSTTRLLTDSDIKFVKQTLFNAIITFNINDWFMFSVRPLIYGCTREATKYEKSLSGLQSNNIGTARKSYFPMSLISSSFSRDRENCI